MGYGYITSAVAASVQRRLADQWRDYSAGTLAHLFPSIEAGMIECIALKKHKFTFVHIFSPAMLLADELHRLTADQLYLDRWTEELNYRYPNKRHVIRRAVTRELAKQGFPRELRVHILIRDAMFLHEADRRRAYDDSRLFIRSLAF